MANRIVVGVLFLVGLILCSGATQAQSTVRLPGSEPGRQADGPADLIVLAERIWTGDPAAPWASALAARGGVITALGSREEILRWKGPRTEVLDRPSDFAVPGLIDAHGHVESLGASLEEVDLRGVNTLEDVSKRVKARHDQTEAEAWIRGGRWDQSLWPGGAFPTAAVLDAVAPDRPVWLTRVDGHAGWANSEAMHRAGITRETQSPSDGQVLRDAAGNPTGVFIDGAMNLVWRVIPAPRPADLQRRILKGQEQILAQGLTGVHDAGISDAEATIYRELDRSGRLLLRVYGMAQTGTGKEVAFASKPPQRASETSRFTLRAIKFFIDGAMGSRGALLFAPYQDDPTNTGLQQIDPKVLEAATVAALRNGWQICTHAIGDRGNALVLDAYAAALKSVPQARDPRLRIEHAQVVRKEDVARFAAHGIIASMQPSHASDDMRWADARLGPGRVDGAYAWRWFLDARVAMAFGSDFPVEIVNPLWGLYAAVTRADAEGKPPGGWHPDQILSLDEALRGFTSGAAYAAFAEDRVGTLKVGMQADLTLLDRDLFRATPAELLKSRATTTVIAGRVAFTRP